MSLVTPTIEWTTPFLLTMIALIGNTITPWGQFFIQSYVVDKGLDIKHYKLELILKLNAISNINNFINIKLKGQSLSENQIYCYNQ